MPVSGRCGPPTEIRILTPETLFRQIRLEAISKIEKWFEVKDGVES